MLMNFKSSKHQKENKLTNENQIRRYGDHKRERFDGYSRGGSHASYHSRDRDHRDRDRDRDRRGVDKRRYNFEENVTKMSWDFIFHSNFSNILTDIQQWGTRAVITYLTMQHHTIHPKLDRSIQVVVRLRIDIHRAAVLIG